MPRRGHTRVGKISASPNTVPQVTAGKQLPSHCARCPHGLGMLKVGMPHWLDKTTEAVLPVQSLATPSVCQNNPGQRQGTVCWSTCWGKQPFSRCDMHLPAGLAGSSEPLAGTADPGRQPEVEQLLAMFQGQVEPSIVTEVWRSLGCDSGAAADALLQMVDTAAAVVPQATSGACRHSGPLPCAEHALLRGAACLPVHECS